jgi:2-phosphoglycerate kinase
MMGDTDWTVLLIGGPSGVGKTGAARRIGRQRRVSVLHVDDLRLAFQHSGATLPDAAATRALYLFWDDPDVWRRLPDAGRDGLIAVGHALSPAIEVVAVNHLAQAEMGPLVIEGDNIVPALIARPLLREYATDAQVRAVFLVEPDEAALLANIAARGRVVAGQSDAERRTEARAKWLYGQWLATEAGRLGLPVLEPRPWDTLDARLAAAINAPERP